MMAMKVIYLPASGSTKQDRDIAPEINAHAFP